MKEERFAKDVDGSCREYFLTCFHGICLEELKKQNHRKRQSRYLHPGDNPARTGRKRDNRSKLLALGIRQEGRLAPERVA